MLSKKRLIVITIMIAVIIALAIGILPSVIKENQKQTGKEWFLEQGKYLDDIKKLIDSMDDVYALYIAEDISPDTFVDNLDTFSDELLILKSAYHQTLKDKPVKIETHTYYTKTGCEAIEDLYGILEELLADSYNEYPWTMTLAYDYMAYTEKVSDCLVRYYNAYNVIYYEDNPEIINAIETEAE